MRWFREQDSDDPATMTEDRIIGVRIGLRLAAVMLDNRALMTPRRRKVDRAVADQIKTLADEVFSLRDLYDPRPQQRAA